MDPILYWNDAALEANRESHTNGADEQTGPPLSSRALAIVHLAMYDAFAGASGNPPDLPPYLSGLPAVSGASPAAAAAAAAHETLVALFPSQREAFDRRLAQAELSGPAAQIYAGVAFGRHVAREILADRASDPGVGADGYLTSTAPGRYRVDPDNPTQVPHAPRYGAEARCFAVTARHALDKPPAPGEVAYDDAVAEVRAKGITPELAATVPASARRTTDETVQGLFWAYDGARGLGTPPRFYNLVVRRVAQAQGNTPAQNARLFALVNAAMADAGILSWEQKYLHDLWRPVTGIREFDASMGAEGVPSGAITGDTDPCWLPLGSPRTNAGGKNFTPPFPAYPSGHATFGAAAFQITRLFYGHTSPGPDPLADGLHFVSEELDGVSVDNRGTVRPRHVRSFANGLWQMIQENSISRVFLGVHWVFDGYAPAAGGGMDLSQNVGGVRLGITIAEDIFNGAPGAGLIKSTV